jgi:hypothetical protein
MKKFSLCLALVMFILFIAVPAFSAEKQTITGKVVSFGFGSGDGHGRFCVVVAGDGQFTYGEYTCYSDSWVNAEDLAIIHAYLVKAKERDESITIVAKAEDKASVVMHAIYTIKFLGGAEFKIHSWIN